ncbi:MAG: YdgA family protein [Tatlockia sp.]|jgi:uncharacterized protein YdgA (DUF945 family)
MKKFTGLVVILVLALVLASYGMGYLTEKKIKEDLHVVNQSNGLTAQIKEYHRGWFSSQVVLDWRLVVPEHVVNNANGQPETIPSQEYRMKMPLTIHHGPIIFTGKTVKFGFGYANSELGLPPELTEQFNNAFADKSIQPKLDLSLFVSYLNNSSIDASIPSFKLLAKQGNGEFDWFGMNSATTVSSDRNKVNGTLTIEGFSVGKEQVRTEVSGISSEYNLHKTETGIYLGDANLSFTSLSITNKDKKIFDLSQFDIQSDTNIEDNLFHSHFKSSIEKVIANGKTYGPGNLEVSIRNLDAQVLARINDQFNRAQQGSDAERQQALLVMLPELPKLFSQGAEFEVTEMNFVVPQGKIEGNLLISLPKGNLSNPFELVQKIQGKGKLKVPALVVKELLTETIKQRLMTAPQPPQSIQQGIVQQMQQQTDAQHPAPASTQEAPKAPAATPDANAPVPAATAPAALTLEQASAQAAEMADKQLGLMVESGILVQQGSDYLIEFNLSQGKISVNNKPFNPNMMKLQ